MAGKSFEIHLHFWSQKYIQRVLRLPGTQTTRDVDYVGAVMDYAFGEQKARRQFAVVSRGAHGDRHAPATNPDFQRLFPRNAIAFEVSPAARAQRESVRRKGLVAWPGLAASPFHFTEAGAA